MTKLNRLGWDFEVISCLDKDKYAQKLREREELETIFGDVFSFIDCALDFTKERKSIYLTDILERIIIGLKILLRLCRVWS